MNIRDINYKLSEKIFLLGIFLLASTMSIGIILILIASIISIYEKKENIFKDKWSKVLIFGAFLMTISCLYQTYDYSNKDLLGWDISLTWIGLLNWIPFFFLFETTKFFLLTPNQRFNVAILLLSGSIPVLITGFGQYFFNWEGPLSFLNGLVVWYLKPIEPHLGLSGLFSNQNYAGTWLSIIWPFSLGFLFINKNISHKKYTSILLLFLFTLAVILTTSRNALFGIFISIPFVFGIRSFLFILIIIFFLAIVSIFRSVIPFAEESLGFLFNIFPQQFVNKFSKFDFINFLEYRRIDLWNNAIKIISQKPLFGLGAAFFPILYEFYYEPKSYTEQHTHNLFIELTASYGILVSLTIFIFIVSLIYLSFRKLKNHEIKGKDLIIDRSWLASTSVLLISQMNDITYFDGRISIMFWIFLSGLRNIIDKKINYR
tara:strand:- start:858 stop:2150 length:1293 start_codon:yes stop_codon:yes gene_type:complete